eukprot:5097605-Prymnesium_polylepis.1
MTKNATFLELFEEHPNSSYELRRKFDTTEHSVKVGVLNALRLFKRENLMLAYNVASCWQIHTLQASLVLLLTPVPDERMHRSYYLVVRSFIRKAYSNDPEIASFKKAVDEQLLAQFPLWKHGEPPDDPESMMGSRLTNLRPGSSQHNCSKPLPLDVPVDHVELAFKAIVERLEAALDSGEDQHVSCVNVALRALGRERKELAKAIDLRRSENGQALAERRRLLQAGELTDQAAAGLSARMHEHQSAMELLETEDMKIRRRMEEHLADKKKLLNKEFWKGLSAAERRMIQPNAA